MNKTKQTDEGSSSRQHRERGVLKAVSNGLKKIPFHKKGKEHAIAHVTIMNIPPLAAKRDASYKIALDILRDKIESTSSGELLVAYMDALKLLNISEKAHHEMINAITKAGRKNIVDAHGVYLRLFSDMVSAALFVLSSSSVICADEQTVTYLLGSVKSEKTREMLSMFGKCESDLRKSIVELYTRAAPTIEKEKAKMQKRLNADDRERYDKSFQEFLKKLIAF